MARTPSMTAQDAAALLGVPGPEFAVTAANRNLARKFAVAYGMSAVAAGSASNATLARIYSDACRRDPSILQAAREGVLHRLAELTPARAAKPVDEVSARRMIFSAVNELQSGVLLNMMRELYALDARVRSLEAEVATLRNKQR
jgi:hypothetical protein